MRGRSPFSPRCPRAILRLKLVLDVTLLLLWAPRSVGQPRRLRASPIRQQILDLLEQRPGLSVAELMKHLSLGWGSLYHHIRYLEAANEIATIRVASRRILLLPYQASDENAILARACLKRPTARRVAEQVSLAPGARISQIAEALGESERAVYYHVKQLLTLKLLTSASRTRHFGLRSTPMLEAILEEAASEQRSPPPGRVGRGARSRDRASSTGVRDSSSVPER